MRIIITVFILIGLSSCAFAPMSSTYTARTNGDGGVNLDVGANADLRVPYVRFGYGFFERLDLGFLMETSALVNAIGLWTKIGLIQNDNGLSWSLIGSYGDAGAGNYYYGGTIASLKLKKFELYGLVRYNHVDADADDIELGNLLTIPLSYQLDYWQYTLGANIWLAGWFGINFNTTVFEGDVRTRNTVLFGGALLFRL